MVAVAKRITIAEADKGGIRRALELLAQAVPGAGAGLFFANADGGNVAVDLSPKTIEAVRSVLMRLDEANEVLLVNEEAEVSPEEAGKVLGISRPLVYQRMDDGRLPYRQVGTHRRIALRDVIALKPSEDKRRDFAKRLSEDTDDLEVNYAPIDGPA